MAKIIKKMEKVKVDDLIPYAQNPKKHPPEQVDKIASSIKNFGFTVPLIVDSQNEIIAGHGRFEAARKLGLEEIPVIKRNDLTDPQIKALRIADNKIAESEWDYEMLSLELETLEIEGWDLEATGFGEDEVDSIMSGMPQVIDNSDDDEDRGVRTGVGKSNMVISIGTLSAVVEYELVQDLIAKMKERFGKDEEQCIKEFARWFTTEG